MLVSGPENNPRPSSERCTRPDDVNSGLLAVTSTGYRGTDMQTFDLQQVEVTRQLGQAPPCGRVKVTDKLPA
jgi:hypothetical protein